MYVAGNDLHQVQQTVAKNQYSNASPEAPDIGMTRESNSFFCFPGSEQTTLVLPDKVPCQETLIGFSPSACTETHSHPFGKDALFDRVCQSPVWRQIKATVAFNPPGAYSQSRALYSSIKTTTSTHKPRERFNCHLQTVPQFSAIPFLLAP